MSLSMIDWRLLLALIGDVLLLAALIVLWLDHRRLKHLVSRVAAHKPSVPSPAIILDWQRKRAELPQGSPKHTAYTNRLREVGALKN